MVIYVDVLFVLNFSITYLLLMLTKLFNRKSTSLLRLMLASALGGFYALVILFDELHFLITIFGRLAVSALIILIAFGFKRVSFYIKNLLIFYFSNMLLLGIILAVWLIAKPDGIAVHNNVPYFDIPAYALLSAALFAYLISVLIVRLHNSSISKNEVYSLTIFAQGEELHMFAFADSGNKLKEPFSNYPVIIADESKISFEPNRIIPFSTVGGEGTLKAFKPDKVKITSGKISVETDKVYIAASSVESQEYSAILNPEILKL